MKLMKYALVKLGHLLRLVRVQQFITQILMVIPMEMPILKRYSVKLSRDMLPITLIAMITMRVSIRIRFGT